MARRGMIAFLLGAFWALGISAAAADESACTPSGADPGKLGVVVLHGKNTFGPDRRAGTGGGVDWLASLKSALEKAGFHVAAPVMPWTRERVYSVSYLAAMDEIAAAANGLKSQGAARIAIIGHSLGGNAAIGYGALKGDAVAIVAIAPAQNPDLKGFADKVADSLAQARAMVAAGKGGESADFKDLNSGNRFGEVRTTAANYLSYFDPNGPVLMPRNVQRLKPGTALLWIVAEEDPLSRLGRGYAYDKAPPNPLNRYIEISSDHLHAPDAAKDIVVAWLKCL